MKRADVFSEIAFCATVCMLLLVSSPSMSAAQRHPALSPLMRELEKSLSYARGPRPQNGKWPRTITYDYRTYDFRENIFRDEKKTVLLAAKPTRIIPHSAGIAEILWAICPRQRLVAFNEISADPEYSFIADQIRNTGRVFTSLQTEQVLGYRPDLVFTVFYSDAAFKKKLKQAGIPCLDLGYFGSISSIKKQVLLLGSIIGEESNAHALVRTMDSAIRQLRKELPQDKKQQRVLYYDTGGYIPGRTSGFASICDIIQVINIGTEQGIRSWAQIDYETLLKWDPDVIIVPAGSHLKETLTTSRILSHARAIQRGKVYDVPRRYLAASSQYIVLSARLLAGIVYEKSF